MNGSAYLPVVRWTQCPQKQPSLRAKRLNFAAEAMSSKRWRRFLRWLTALAQVYIYTYYIFCIVFAFAFWFTKPRMIDHIYDGNAKLLFYFFKDGWRNQQKWGRTPKSEFAKSKRKLVFKSSSWNVVCSLVLLQQKRRNLPIWSWELKTTRKIRSSKVGSETWKIRSSKSEVQRREGLNQKSQK